MNKPVDAAAVVADDRAVWTSSAIVRPKARMVAVTTMELWLELETVSGSEVATVMFGMVMPFPETSAKLNL